MEFLCKLTPAHLRSFDIIDALHDICKIPEKTPENLSTGHTLAQTSSTNCYIEQSRACLRIRVLMNKLGLKVCMSTRCIYINTILILLNIEWLYRKFTRILFYKIEEKIIFVLKNTHCSQFLTRSSSLLLVTL